MGRFINQDPLRLAGGDYNLYRYVGNSPLNATDPSGLVEAEERAVLWKKLNAIANAAVRCLAKMGIKAVIEEVAINGVYLLLTVEGTYAGKSLSSIGGRVGAAPTAPASYPKGKVLGEIRIGVNKASGLKKTGYDKLLKRIEQGLINKLKRLPYPLNKRNPAKLNPLC